jgi:undecaprenyl-diphosphatase
VDLALFGKAVIMGLVEGITEFLPISSTGHLIVTGSLIGFHDEKAKVFDIAIQTGAIFAVILVYWQRIWATIRELPTQAKAQRFAGNVLIAFFPAVILGLAYGKAIKSHLFNANVVAVALIVGGVIIWWAEKRQKVMVRVDSVDEMRPMDALKVGVMQCLAMIPGTSRSGATIIGGMLIGLSRRAATDFSFYLAIPTLIGAGVYSLYKDRAVLAWSDIPLFAVGTVVAFFSALWCIRWLLRYISSHSFMPFAWYRIAFGFFILLSSASGLITWAT